MGLAQSEPTAVAAAGLRHLCSELSKLEHIVASVADGGKNAHPLPRELLFSVVHLLHTHPERGRAGAANAKAISMELLKFHSDSSDPLILLPIKDCDSFSMNLKGPLHPSSFSAPTVDPSAFVRDLGYAATSSSQVFSAVLAGQRAAAFLDVDCTSAYLFASTATVSNTMVACLSERHYS